MQPNKPELIIFCQNKLGGVQNYYRNLLEASAFEDFNTKVIYTEDIADNETKLPQKFNCADEEVVFTYSTGDSMYNTFRRLAKLVTKREGVIFTNMPLELGFLQHHQTGKAIVSVVHDEMYIQNAIRYSFLIDVYIAHNISIFHLLKRLMPDRGEDIHYLPYGISISEYKRKPNSASALKLLFIGRLHALKGIFDLPVIDDQLKEGGVLCEWSIIGDGPEKENLFNQISNRNNFKHYNPKTTNEVLEIASGHDLFILPSRIEGIPVSLLEAMSVGLVPLIGAFNEGILEVVTAESGFIIPVENINKYAEKIIELNYNRALLETMSGQSGKKIEQDYNAVENAKAYRHTLAKYQELKSSRKTALPVTYGNGRLDKPYIPYFFIKGARGISGLLSRLKTSSAN